MSNRLAKEQSPYLKQHAENPVDWYPWGEEAFSAARASDKPVLVSIGYSACHWCHVMAHECFENNYIADLMNRHFVCIKVDREEHPDVDQVYMEAVQMIHRHGGWPLNVFCLPDGRPFFGGTYFPPEDRGQGLIPWPQVLMRVADYHRRSRDELTENADAIEKNIRSMNRMAVVGAGEGDGKPDAAALFEAARGICGNLDEHSGGFGNAPKFPPAMALNFLESVRRMPGVEAESAPKPAEGDGAAKAAPLSERIDEARRTTLRGMACGGLFDQIGGGFSRYCVDAEWRIPHFEKMLYDNALLLEAYTRGWQAEEDPLYAAVVEETVEWLERDMGAPCGGFYASLDADSDGKEGAYYVWTPEEVARVLDPEEAREICAAYGITEEGNFEAGKSHPNFVARDVAVREKLGPARRKLLDHRIANRNLPGKDVKIPLAWNGMMVRALAEAGFVFNRPAWLKRARAAADFLWREMTRMEEDGGVRLYAVFYEESGPRIEGYLHDYAVAAEAFLALAGKADWLEPGQADVYLGRARACVDSALRLFDDSEGPGFFFTAADVDTPVARRKEWFDNATPSGNSSLLHALSGLRALTGEERYGRVFGETVPAYSEFAGKIAAGVAHALEAAANERAGVGVFRIAEGAPVEPVRRVLAGRPWRRVFVRGGDVEGGKRYQLCAGAQCFPPTDDPEEAIPWPQREARE